MISLWQIDDCNRANAKLRAMIEDPRIAFAIRAGCGEHSAPYWEGRPLESFENLYGLIAASRSSKLHPTESAEIIRGQMETRQQMVCEEMSKKILDSLNIQY